MQKKHLGVDHGRKRVGVSISDEAGLLSLPLEVISGKDRHLLLARIVEIVKDYGIEAVIIGHPLTLMGESGAQARQAEDFARRLSFKLGAGIEVRLWDERLTSREVDRVRPEGKKHLPDGTRDLMAAVLILQSYLDSQVKRNGLG